MVPVGDDRSGEDPAQGFKQWQSFRAPDRGLELPCVLADGAVSVGVAQHDGR